MRSWLLAWNPRRSTGRELSGHAQQVQRGRVVHDQWSCGVNKSIRPRDRVFLIRLGVEPRGIVAAGFATSAPWMGRAWRGKETRSAALYVDIAWDALLDADPESDRFQPPLRLSMLRRGPRNQMNWTTQASGVSIPEGIAASLERIWHAHYTAVARLGPLNQVAVQELHNDDVDEDLWAVEGELRTRLVLHRRRERRLRHLKIRDAVSKGPLACEVPGCGFDFERVYGALGAGFAEVHHTKSLASRARPAKTRVADLAIVCANCHRMIHKGGASRPLNSIFARRKRPHAS